MSESTCKSTTTTPVTFATTDTITDTAAGNTSVNIAVTFEGSAVSFTLNEQTIMTFDYTGPNKSNCHDDQYSIDFLGTLDNKASVQLVFNLMTTGWTFKKNDPIALSQSSTGVTKKGLSTTAALITIENNQTKRNATELLGSFTLNVVSPTEQAYSIDPMFSRRRT